ncbi:unnamed protein product [Cochlearia groenlandica]
MPPISIGCSTGFAKFKDMRKEYPNMGLYLTVDKIGKSDSGNDLPEEVSYDKLVEAVAEEERFHKEDTSNVCDEDENFQEMGGEGFVDVMLAYVDEGFMDEVDAIFYCRRWTCRTPF